jgi:hypothetical protein
MAPPPPVDTHCVPAGQDIIAQRSSVALRAAGAPGVAHETVASATAVAPAMSKTNLLLQQSICPFVFMTNPDSTRPERVVP